MENLGRYRISFLADTLKFFRFRILFCYSQKYSKGIKKCCKMKVKCEKMKVFTQTGIEDFSFFTILIICVFPLPFLSPVNFLEPFYLTLTLLKLKRILWTWGIGGCAVERTLAARSRERTRLGIHRHHQSLGQLRKRASLLKMPWPPVTGEL